MDHKHKRINGDIRAEKVKLINETGEPIGVMPLSQALEMAEKAEMDIVEV
jgi:translation initiation factor IF-3